MMEKILGCWNPKWYSKYTLFSTSAITVREECSRLDSSTCNAYLSKWPNLMEAIAFSIFSSRGGMGKEECRYLFMKHTCGRECPACPTSLGLNSFTTHHLTSILWSLPYLRGKKRESCTHWQHCNLSRKHLSSVSLHKWGHPME